ncbi:MAG TPA: SDR family oxidoreductase [Ideonella sp.]|nr:SDR family oxidoreductase [Ideonella sp.]
MSPRTAPRPVALVTGAPRRIGRAIVLELAAHGFDLAVHCRHWGDDAEETAADARALGAAAQVFQADLADEAECRALLPAVLAHFGRADAVVNNASLFEYDNAETAAPDAMQRHWQANTAAPVLLAQALAAHLAGRDGRGCVVNLLDQKLDHPNPDYFSYTLSKAALASAGRMLALALAPHVRVVGVSPGLTLGSELIDDHRLQRLQAQAPLGYGIGAEDVAAAVRFALQSRAMTGCTLLVDAGQHLLPRARDFAFDTPPLTGPARTP